MHQIERALFTLRREGHFHVSLSKSFPQVAIGGAHAAPPARQHFLAARQRAREEIKIFAYYGIVQVRRRSVQQLPAKIGFPVLHRMLLDELLELAEKFR